LALLVAYGVDVSQEQQTAILGFVSVIAPLVAALAIRGNVFSPVSAAAEYHAGLKDSAQPFVPSSPAT
ncbi:MAG: hypothetical protein ACR2OE_01275, partial [Thermomicrobiales bacterium]